MKSFFLILSLIRMIKCDIEYLVVGGDKALITDFPHSAYLEVYLKKDGTYSTCGASIVNQRIMLTAAHCVDKCDSQTRVSVSVGSSFKQIGTQSSVHMVYKHENYERSRLLNDIALLALKTDLKLNDHVQRVALMKNPPYFEKARVAGWGLIKDVPPVQTPEDLYYVDQYVWEAKVCEEMIVQLHRGMFCASSASNSSYISRGDSGSALVVRGYIQIGLVSFKVYKRSKSMAVYADTGYYYDWIRKNSKKLYCASEAARKQ